jgi:tetratricopeptide (TPR) repeat protein
MKHPLTWLAAARVFVTGLALMVGADAAAERINPAAEFDRALKAFRAGDYNAALQGFLRAQAAGMDRPALHYNLGVTYYKLERYAEAESVFQALMKNPEHAPLAGYNLGLIAMKQGRDRVAARMFRRTAATAENPKLKALAVAALDRLGAVAEPSPWRGFASAHAGHDGNAVLAAEAETVGASGRSDSYGELFARIQGPLTGTRREGLQLDAGVYSLRYKDLSEYDFENLHVGAAYRHTHERWSTETGVDYDYSHVGGAGFLRSASLVVQGRRRWESAHLRLSYRGSRIDDASPAYAYPYLAGWRQLFAAQSIWRHDAFRWKLGYSLELNDRDDLVQGAEFYSYSPTRHGLYVDGIRRLGDRWEAKLGFAYQYSRYGEPDTRSIDGNLVTKRREDKRTQLTARLQHRLTEEWELSGSYTRTVNNSNFNAEEYTRNIYALGVARSF